MIASLMQPRAPEEIDGEFVASRVSQTHVEETSSRLNKRICSAIEQLLGERDFITETRLLVTLGDLSRASTRS